MTKFHDEFFRKTTPEHDELIALTIDNLEEIVEEIVPIKNLIDEEKETTVYICCHENRTRFCNLKEGHRVAFDHEPTCLENTKTYSLNVKEDATIEKGPSPPDHLCSYLDLPETIKVSELQQDNPLIQEYPGLKPYLWRIKPQRIETKNCTYNTHTSKTIVKETETVCRSNLFIIGYADIVADVYYTIKYSLAVDENWVIKDKITERHAFRIIIDAKPELKSRGGPLRQLKTYMQTLGKIRSEKYVTWPPIGAIVTFSKLPEKHKKILRSEDVAIVEFEKNGAPSLSRYLTETSI